MNGHSVVMPVDPALADAAGYTIDELATAAGVPTRTIRHYQSEKVLQAPEKRGRVAVYRDAHLERLRQIRRLQERGLSLKAIREALRDVQRGRRRSLEDWLGLGTPMGLPDGDRVASPGEHGRDVDGAEPQLSAPAGQLMRKHLRKAADELVAHFVEHAGDGFGQDAGGVAAALDRLRPLGSEALPLIFAREIERALLECRDELADSSQPPEIGG